MSDNTTDTSVAFLILSALLILVGFAVSGGGAFSLLAVFLSLFGKSELSFWAASFALPALWTALFILGWHWYGRAALWLLLVAPFAFYYLLLL